MSKAGIGKKKFGVVGEGDEAKTVRVNGPVILPDLQHVTSGPRLKRLLVGIKGVVPAESYPAQAAEMSHAMGLRAPREGGKAVRRALRRNIFRKSALDLGLILAGERKGGSPRKQSMQQHRKALRVAKMARMTVALLIRGTWGYHGKAPALVAATPVPAKGMDLYHAKIAAVGTSVYTPKHPRVAKDGVFFPSQDELDKIAATIAADREAARG